MKKEARLSLSADLLGARPLCMLTCLPTCARMRLRLRVFVRAFHHHRYAICCDRTKGCDCDGKPANAYDNLPAWLNLEF